VNQDGRNSLALVRQNIVQVLCIYVEAAKCQKKFDGSSFAVCEANPCKGVWV